MNNSTEFTPIFCKMLTYHLSLYTLKAIRFIDNEDLQNLKYDQRESF